MHSQRRVLALIPAYNEEKRIGSTVSALASSIPEAEIIVVDDGSSDGTAAAAERQGVRVMRTGRNLGKGSALNFAMERLPWNSYQTILLLDADLEESAARAGPLLEEARRGTDLVIGVLPKAMRKGGFGLVKGTARWMIRRKTSVDPQAPLSGQRALSPAAVRAALPFAPGFGIEVAMTLAVAEAGLSIREVPVEMSHAETGRDVAGVLHRARQFIDVLMLLIRR